MFWSVEVALLRGWVSRDGVVWCCVMRYGVRIDMGRLNYHSDSDPEGGGCCEGRYTGARMVGDLDRSRPVDYRGRETG